MNVRRTTALEQSGGKVVLGLGSNKGEGQKRTYWRKTWKVFENGKLIAWMGESRECQR